MERFRLLLALLFTASLTYGQESNIGQFAVWKPKDGQLQNFENGYKHHLDWHRKNGDKWAWYGWFIVSGSRYGQFVDATFDRSWADFDRPVKPAEDITDNRLHVFPFGDVQTIYKVSLYAKASTADTLAMRTNLIKLVTLTVEDVEQTLKLAEKLKDFYCTKKIRSFKTYKVVDGGAINQIIFMMGFDNWEEYSMSESFSEKVTQFEQSIKSTSISSIYSETMMYRPDMSWFPK